MTGPVAEKREPLLMIRAPLSEDSFVSVYFSSSDGRLMSEREWWHLKQLVELANKIYIKQDAKAQAAGAGG
jgi:hypothetical protein